MTSALRARSDQQAALVVYDGGPAVRASQVQALVPFQFNSREARYADAAALVPYTTQARIVRESVNVALVVYAANPYNIPEDTQEYALVVWGTTPPGDENRSRAWCFTLDGHLFYVLDLGQEGTYLYDMSTGQWCQFRTEGFLGWNMRVGTTWQAPNRVVAGDTLYGYVWELSPTDLLDEEFRPIEHIATGGIMTRSRVYVGVEAVRIAASIGQVQDSENGILTKMKFSDDAGKTWSDDFVVQITEGDFDNEIAYRSLGSFMAPGRVFEFSDLGGMLRIDGADLFAEDFDSEAELVTGYRLKQ